MNFIKKLLPNKSLASIIVFVMVVILMQIDFAHAAPESTVISKFFGYGLVEFINQALAQLFTVLQSAAAMLIILAGFLLNFSINLTLNIREFVDQTPAIFTTWKALRDISGLFIIFFLLYAAIQLITGIRSPKFGDLIKNIVLAGVLINFSFFFAGLGIDASNIVSVQLYNAIAPASSLNAKNLSPNNIEKIAPDGGLSDIFMQSLRITDLYKSSKAVNSGTAQDSTATDPFKIVLIGVVSIIIMLTAAFSFAAAACMFIIRFVLLLFLLAFSPIWFMSFISPELKKYSDDWTKYYKSMLLIMPVYLLLMYMSLNVLTSTNLFKTYEVTANSAWYSPLLSLTVNAVIVIFMMNIPLLGAISIGGKAVEFLGADKFGATNVWKKVGAFSGRNTIGAGAAAISKSAVARRIYAENPMIGSALNKGLGKISSSGFGDGKNASYDAARKAKIKDYSELAKKSNYTEEEVAEYASKKISGGGDTIYNEAKAENDRDILEEAQIQAELDQHRDLAAIGPGNPTAAIGIEKLIADTQARLTEKKKDIEKSKKALEDREKAVKEGFAKERQTKAAERLEGPTFINRMTGGKIGRPKAHSQSENRAIADAIRKGQSNAEKIMAALKAEEDAKPKPATSPKS